MDYHLVDDYLLTRSHRLHTSLMPQADKLNIKYESTQCRAFSVGKTRWIENGCEKPLPVKKLLKEV